MSRPAFHPTDEQRLLVKSLAAYGIAHEAIAGRVGLRSPKTLRRHFRKELDSGALEAEAKVRMTLWQMATSGKNFPATQFWLHTRARMAERRRSLAPETPQRPAFVVLLESEPTGAPNHAS